MQTRLSFAVLIGLSCLTACSSTDKKDPLLEEAVRYHSEATNVQAALEPKIEQVDSLKTILAKQPTAANATRIATLDSLKTAFEDWETNLIEVPGMPHNHNHRKAEHHRHADATLKDLPANHMRDIQRETLKSIQHIQVRFEAVTQSR